MPILRSPPLNLIKYEIDKTTGYLRVDRPQRTSSTPPALYGFIPRTYCDRHVAALASTADRGDGDPLDICVLSERPINRAEVILNARVVGGVDVNDGGEADDKIIAVLENDSMWGAAHDIDDLPAILIERLRHYFATYKMRPGEPTSLVCRADVWPRTRLPGNRGCYARLPRGVWGLIA